MTLFSFKAVLGSHNLGYIVYLWPLFKFRHRFGKATTFTTDTTQANFHILLFLFTFFYFPEI